MVALPSRLGTLAVAVLAVAAAGAQPVVAESDPLWEQLTRQRSYGGVRIGFDEQGSRSAQLDFDLGLANGARVLAGAGGASLDSNGERLESGEWRLGVSGDPLLPWAGRAELGWWGNRGEVETESLRVGVVRQFKHGAIGVNLEWRDLRLYTRPLALPVDLPEFFDTDSEGWEIELRIDAAPSWEFALRYERVDYSANVSRLGTSLFAPFVFSPQALGLASGLVDAVQGLSVTRYLAESAVTVRWERSRSAIDRDDSDLLALEGGLALSPRWDLGVEVGGFEGGDGNTVLFGTIAITRSW